MVKTKKVLRNIGKVLTGIAKGYRKGTDWAKPTIDKVVDPLFFVLGSNAILSSGIYYAKEGLDKFETFQSIDGFFDDHSVLEALAKIGFYTAAYGVANFNKKKLFGVNLGIIENTKKIFKRKTKPSWLNHIKTWGFCAGAALAFYCGGIKEDVNRFKEEFKKSESFSDYVNVFTDETNLRVFDNYLSGNKSSKFLEDLVNQPSIFISKILNKDDSDKIMDEVEDSENKNKDFDYVDKISKDAEKFIEGRMIATPEQLVYLTRVAYFEGGHDRKAKDKKAVKEGLQGIVSVINNRYKYDSYREKNGKKRGFSKKGDNLFDLTFHHGKNKYGGTTWQFTCIRDHPKYFYEQEGKKGWDMYENGKLNIAIGKMNKERTSWCYDVVLNVLKGKLKDNTNGALYYQNIAFSDKHNKNWEKRYNVKKTAKINSHTFYRPKNLHSNWAKKID